jgi:hypothetical protein
MNPLMLDGMVPDSGQVSRDAAERHAILTAGRSHDDASPAGSSSTTRGGLTWFLRSHSASSASSA